MESEFAAYIEKSGLLSPKDQILVAVSGGVDSMVLATVLNSLGYHIALAHCNYQLRGEDSDVDEELVKNWALEREIPFHSRRIDTKRLVQESTRSTQMVAREERYRFFEELMDEHGYVATALAHHQDDRLESLLMNVLRGTGIRGFVGMPVRRDRYIRPLLFASKKEIREYAVSNQIPFRDDISNQQVVYKRNWVRLRLLPMLRQVHPNIDKDLLRFSKAVEKELPNYHNWKEKESQKLATGNGQHHISVSRLKAHKYP
ncbi:MAG: tRNA lysidine(34) synthetase TilS, partial [Flavobacteriales bacterium]|nr:tRNA lysidine(34) synthetase TilS [Flavobacteriales bacterium]